MRGSLEMRTAGNETHIQIGLADMIIAAAPALRLIATTDTSCIPQCLIYLIEGMQVHLSRQVDT